MTALMHAQVIYTNTCRLPPTLCLITYTKRLTVTDGSSALAVKGKKALKEARGVGRWCLYLLSTQHYVQPGLSISVLHMAAEYRHLKRIWGDNNILMERKKFIYGLIDYVQRPGLGIKDRREVSKKNLAFSLWT